MTRVEATLAPPTPGLATGTERPAPRVPLTLHALVRRGTLWSIAGYGGAQALRFAGNLVLTRLLMPEAFGLMALVNAVQQGLVLFSDLGIGPSIVQGKRGEDPAFLNTAWTMQTLRGLGLACAAAAIAAPFASFYGNPLLAWVLIASASTALISGFNSTRLYSAYRRVDLARVSVIEIGSQAVGLAAILAWASVDRSVWALVAGGIAGSLTNLALTFVILPGIPNRFCWDRSAVAQIFRFGRRLWG